MPAVAEREKLESLHPAKEINGQLFVCDVKLYRTLFNQVLQKSEGDLQLAKEITSQAIRNDSTSLVQENISALKDEKGQFIVDDLRIRASMQQTPTKHVYYQTKDQTTGQDIITSPEYIYLGESITTALTDWRRGNDKAVMKLVQPLHLTLPPNQREEEKEKVDYTLLWASPTAENWENEWIRKYNGEYGYLYVGHLTEESGVRKMEVYSYKTDLKTASYLRLMTETGGILHHPPEEINPDKVYKDSMAELRDDVDLPKRPLLDHLMRTVAVIDGPLSGNDVISRMYKAKVGEEGSDRMFGIKEETMHSVQDPNLRDRIEKEVSVPVANWLSEQIISGVAGDVIQNRIRDKYIFYTKALVRKMKEQETQLLLKKPQHQADPLLIIDEKRISREDLRRMTQLKGGFCGDWGTENSSFSGPLEDLKNYTGISGIRLSAGGFSKESRTCKICKVSEAARGGCGYCNSCAHKAA